MAIYSYIITRDYGFAPNPFYGFCSLATCKPKIRGNASVGDWIVGFGPAHSGTYEKMIFAMKVEKKISFNEYWTGEEYQCKKPVLNGSLKQNYGDNIYHQEKGEWIQSDSHHSFKDGAVNNENLKRDTSADFVLISKTFWYFGKDAKCIPNELNEIIPHCRGYRKPTINEKLLSDWLFSLSEQGFIGEPAKFNKEFERYDGKE